MKKQDFRFVGFMIALGLLFRLLFAADMEWKDDEKLMYQLSTETAAKGTFPEVGMMSGGGVVNPGLSVAVFASLSHFTNSPDGLVKFVQWINVLAILLLLNFIYRTVPLPEKKSWYYALSLAAVSPLAVLFSRKIWAQDLLPLFSVLLIFTIANRKKNVNAFFAGMIAMLIGQIHMSGFFLAAGFVGFSFLYDWYHHHKIKWLAWIAGGVIGCIPLIPWLQYISTHKQGSYLILDHVLQWKFYIYTFLDAHGLNLVYTFEKEITQFYAYPSVNGISLCVVGVLYILLAGIAVYTLWMMVKYALGLMNVFRESGFIKWLFNCSLARFYLQGVFIGLGILMTFSGTEIYPHYLICIFPFSYVWLCKLYIDHKRVLKMIIICQAVLTLLFLSYVHQNNGIFNGDYGQTYGSQDAETRKLHY
ncbi:MAG: hypothetical protein ABI772_12720 [Bacteroidota bacterium]